MSKLITVLIFIFIIGCGGGSSTVDPVKLPPPSLPHLFSYIVTVDGDTRRYTGQGVEVNGIIYVAPTTLGNSEFVVMGEIINNEVRLFSYVTRELVVSFTDGDDSGYHLTLNDDGPIDVLQLSDLNGDWSNVSSAGMFNDPIMMLTYEDGKITGEDTLNCIINGEAFESDFVIGIELTLTNCAHSGTYYGSLRTNGDNIIGAAVSDNFGLVINYKVIL
jgi:hypothetical protein